mmetsp:Transcript_70270/g.209458  ORF Transcript_70270/g.209458 Transcript_70270/m.209458 type:complete len:402 (-) Transcript_70270:6-1211(-)
MVPKAQLVYLPRPAHDHNLGFALSQALVLGARVRPVAEAARLCRVVQEVGLDATPTAMLGCAAQRCGHHDHCVPGKEASDKIQVVVKAGLDVGVGHDLASLPPEVWLAAPAPSRSSGCRNRGSAARSPLDGVLRHCPGRPPADGFTGHLLRGILHGTVEAVAALGPRQPMVHARAAGGPRQGRRLPAGLQHLSGEAPALLARRCLLRIGHRTRQHLLLEAAACADDILAEGSAQECTARLQLGCIPARPSRELVVHRDLARGRPLPPQLESGDETLARRAVRQGEHGLAHDGVAAERRLRAPLVVDPERAQPLSLLDVEPGAPGKHDCTIPSLHGAGAMRLRLERHLYVRPELHQTQQRTTEVTEAVLRTSKARGMKHLQAQLHRAGGGSGASEPLRVSWA